MSVVTSSKVFVGSLLRAYNFANISGNLNTDAVSLYKVIFKSYEYALKKYNSGDTSYFDKIQKLNDILLVFQYRYPEICNHKDVILAQHTNLTYFDKQIGSLIKQE